MGAYPHLLVNHVPVVGTLFVLGLLAYALWRRSHELLTTAFGVCVAVGLVTIPAYLSGEPAENAIEHMPGVEDHYIEDHEEFAEIAFVAVLISGGVAILGLYLARKRPERLQKFGSLLLALTVVSFFLLAWTAKLGGEIRHPETRALPLR